MAITDWPLQERPREKLLRHGVTALSEAELLAIFLRTGIKGKTAVDLARELLQQFHSLRKLFRAGQEQFSKIKGLGLSKYAVLQAALEISRRCFEEEMKAATLCTSIQSAKTYFKAKLSNHRYETFACIFLNNLHNVIQYEELFKGTINCAPIYPRVIAQKALEYNAAAVIFAHNHPSGCGTPSESDISTTQNLINALKPLDIRVLDHIIVGDKDPISFAEQGLLL